MPNTKRKILKLLAITAAILIVQISLATASMAKTIITDLGTLGGSISEATAINGKGQVVGYSKTAEGKIHAFIWENSKMIDLGTFGGDNSYAKSINEKGQVVGCSETTDNIGHAFVWENGKMTDLGTLGGASSYAELINEKGQVIGQSDTADGKEHAFIWEDGKMTDLGTLGGNETHAYSINKKGQVIGQSDTADDKIHAFIWENGKMTDLGTLGGDWPFVAAINEKGQVVGDFTTAEGKIHAFIWENGKMTDLGTLGGEHSEADSINEKGQVSGTADTADNKSHAFIWENGKMADLGALGGGFSYSWDINEKGQVIGFSTTVENKEHAFMWENGKMIDMGALEGGHSRAFKINEKGQVIGMSGASDYKDRHAFISENTAESAISSDSTEIKVFVDTNQIRFDVQPIITNGRVLVPFRVVLEVLDAEVDWDGTTQTVTAKKTGKVIKIKINDKIASVDGKNVSIDVPATIIGGRTLVPLRFISEALGEEVKWNSSTKTVNINTASYKQNIAALADSIFTKKITDNKIPLIDKRLFIRMPDSAKDGTLQNGIMGISSNHKDSMIVLKANEEELFVYAKELFLYSSGNIESDVKKLFDTTNKENLELSTIKSDKGFSITKIIKGIPDDLYPDSNSVLVRRAIVKNSDNTLIHIGIFVTRETFKDKDKCIKLSDDILDTVEAGTRNLDLSPHKEKIEDNMEIDIEKGYVLIKRPADGFSFYNILKIVSSGDTAPCMDVYIGKPLSPDIPQDKIKDLKKSYGNIMGKKVEWVYSKSNDMDNSSTMETMFDIEESKMCIISIYQNNEKDLQEMKGMAESLKIVK